MPRAVYAGSFDPPTRGHEWVLREATRILGESPALAVARHAGKAERFPWQFRVAMLRAIAPDASILEVEPHKLLALWARREGFGTIVRGVRSAGDFDYEAAMSQFNGEVVPEIATMLVVPPRELRDVSSSFVMSLVGLEGWEEAVGKYVHPYVLGEMRAWSEARGRS